jgi:hypothetical protein
MPSVIKDSYMESKDYGVCLMRLRVPRRDPQGIIVVLTEKHVGLLKLSAAVLVKMIYRDFNLETYETIHWIAHFREPKSYEVIEFDDRFEFKEFDDRFEFTNPTYKPLSTAAQISLGLPS